MTAAKPRRCLGVKALAFLVVVTEKPFVLPRPLIAAMPAGIESWRNPEVLEKTSTFARGLGFASGSLEQAISPAAPKPSNTAATASIALAGIRMTRLWRA